VLHHDEAPLDDIDFIICDRPGRVEICVDATDGACTKTLCDNVICPAE
jgi:hypothetical protein